MLSDSRCNDGRLQIHDEKEICIFVDHAARRIDNTNEKDHKIFLNICKG